MRSGVVGTPSHRTFDLKYHQLRFTSASSANIHTNRNARKIPSKSAFSLLPAALAVAPTATSSNWSLTPPSCSSAATLTRCRRPTSTQVFKHGRHPTRARRWSSRPSVLALTFCFSFHIPAMCGSMGCRYAYLFFISLLIHAYFIFFLPWCCDACRRQLWLTNPMLAGPTPRPLRRPPRRRVAHLHLLQLPRLRRAKGLYLHARRGHAGSSSQRDPFARFNSVQPRFNIHVHPWGAVCRVYTHLHFFLQAFTNW